MPTISLIMLAYNNGKTLEYKLQALKQFADEIIIVDLGSIDNTLDAARKFTHKVYNFNWDYNFSDARNFAYNKSSMDYIFWLNSDEVIEKSQMKRLLRLKSKLTQRVDVVYMEGVPRLTKRENKYIWIEPVHEYLLVWGKKLFTNIRILKAEKEKPKMFTDMEIYRNLIRKNETLSEIGTYFYEKAKYKQYLKNRQ